MSRGLFESIIRRQRQDTFASLVLAVTATAEPVYRWAVQRRNRRFDRGLRDIYQAHVPVISIGNITVGGTGKTPTVIDFAEKLLDIGISPAVVMRGYKAAGESDEADEARLIRQRLPEVTVLADPNRKRSIETLRKAQPQVDVILLDDGFQHRRVHRDWDVVLIDATQPTGLGHVLPHGLLREPLENLSRADAVLISHADRVDEDELEHVKKIVEQYHGKAALATLAHQWDVVLDDEDRKVTLSSDTRLWAFCGIGSPQRFIEQAGESADLAGWDIYEDHHHYTADDLHRMAEQARIAGATALLTTEKDWVKLADLPAPPLPIWRVRLTLGYREGQSRVIEHLQTFRAEP